MNTDISLSADEANILEVEGLPALRDRLNNSLNQLTGRAKAFKAKAEAEQRNLTQQEGQQLDKIIKSFDECDYKLRALDDWSLPLGNVPAGPSPPRPPIRNITGPDGFQNHIHGVPMQQHQAIPYNGGARTFDAVFTKRPAPPGAQFNSFGEFALMTLNDPLNPRLRNQTMTESEGVSAGFLVPMQFISALLDRSLEQEIVRPRATILPFDTNSGSIPSFNYQMEQAV